MRARDGPEWNTTDCDEAGWHRLAFFRRRPWRSAPEPVRPTGSAKRIARKPCGDSGDGRYEVDFGTMPGRLGSNTFRGLAPGQTVTMRFLDLPADN